MSFSNAMEIGHPPLNWLSNGSITGRLISFAESVATSIGVEMRRYGNSLRPRFPRSLRNPQRDLESSTDILRTTAHCRAAKASRRFVMRQRCFSHALSET